MGSSIPHKTKVPTAEGCMAQHCRTYLSWSPAAFPVSASSFFPRKAKEKPIRPCSQCWGMDGSELWEIQPGKSQSHHQGECPHVQAVRLTCIHLQELRDGATSLLSPRCLPSFPPSAESPIYTAACLKSCKRELH